MSRLPSYLRGEGPCDDCGTFDNPVWHTESKFWKDVMGSEGGIPCINCFIIRAEKKHKIVSWRLEGVRG